jgi:phosphatidylserine/phosphatidylglycerophosphate/cardiolipin synthase-like enzyme
MKPQDFKEQLQKTLEDQRLSRSERKALQEVAIAASDGQLANLRSIAFDVARAELQGDKRTKHVMQWLEDVVKLLLPAEDDAPDSKAVFSPGDDPLRTIIGLLESCRESCDICVFTITDNRIADAIVACHKRGVRMRIITDNDKAFDKGSDVDRLEKTGVPLRVDFTRHHMHHKFAVFDKVTLLSGSYNWTRSAANHNYENLIVTRDKRLAASFGQAFQDLWNELEPSTIPLGSS